MLLKEVGSAGITDEGGFVQLYRILCKVRTKKIRDKNEESKCNEADVLAVLTGFCIKLSWTKPCYGHLIFCPPSWLPFLHVKWPAYPLTGFSILVKMLISQK